MSWGKSMKLTKKIRVSPCENGKLPRNPPEPEMKSWDLMPWRSPTETAPSGVLKLDTQRWKSRRAADAKLAKSRPSESVLPLQKRTDPLFGWFCLCCDAFWSKVQRETPRSTTSTCMSLNDLGREWDEKHTSISKKTWIYVGILGYAWIYLDHRLRLASRIYNTLPGACEPDLRSHQWHP